MRQALKDQEVGLDPHFRYRGKNQTRVEAFTDAAFALGITLIVLSSSVPDTFKDLWLSVREIIPFGICVILVMVIWYQHYLYFLKYGLQDRMIITLNTILIFLILVYVYPLKFLARFLFELVLALSSRNFDILSEMFGPEGGINDMKYLMILYGLGAALIFFTLALMHLYAGKKKEELKLNEYELFVTQTGSRQNLLMALVPALSVILALVDFQSTTLNQSVAGFTYFLYPPIMIINGFRREKKRKQLIKKLNLK